MGKGAVLQAKQSSYICYPIFLVRNLTHIKQHTRYSSNFQRTVRSRCWGFGLVCWSHASAALAARAAAIDRRQLALRLAWDFEESGVGIDFPSYQVSTDIRGAVCLSADALRIHRMSVRLCLGGAYTITIYVSWKHGWAVGYHGAYRTTLFSLEHWEHIRLHVHLAHVQRARARHGRATS